MYTWRDPCCPRHRSHPSSECGNAGEGRCICTMPREHSKQQEGAEAHISPLSRRGTERAVLDRANMQQACTLQTSPHNAPRKSLQQRQEEEEEEEKEEKGQRRCAKTPRDPNGHKKTHGGKPVGGSEGREGVGGRRRMYDEEEWKKRARALHYTARGQLRAGAAASTCRVAYLTSWAPSQLSR
ncbi:unnamed protein product [Prorocentrum cordatum]|uniref:Uncharacterized protein n=1 Tax=Prorocentrum cordatum TaxID=2364126 RepID=A0ABN9PFR0_9DINO|nr:unnamed protein product [Polarella glacialis]